MTGRILVAIDGSAHSARALEQAVRIGRGLQLPLTLVHATGPQYAETVFSASAGVPMDPKLYEELEAARTAEGQRVLAQAVDATHLPGEQVRTLLVHQPPVDAIVELARDAEVTLVVVGARGHGAVARLLLGGVADRILHLCPKPVLVVP